MKVFAVIVTYNAMRNDWIRKCIDSLDKSTVPVTSIVIDNDSKDGTVEFVKQNCKHVVCLPQNKNLGFGQANNIGIKYAIDNNADYVLLLNQDATIGEDSIEKMVNASKGMALVSPVQRNGDGTSLDIVFNQKIAISNQNIIEQALINKKVENVCKIGFVSAACWMIPIQIIKTIGGFNPLFFHYGEDDNYHQRINFHGFDTLLATDAFMNHDRTLHGNQQMFNKNLIRRDLLNILCNVNWKTKKQIINILKLLKKCYCKYLPEKRYIPGNLTLQILWALTNYNKIRKSRINETKKGLTWISTSLL